MEREEKEWHKDAFQEEKNERRGETSRGKPDLRVTYLMGYECVWVRVGIEEG